MSTATIARRRILGDDRWFALRELILIVAMFVGYRQVRYLTRGDTDAAFANARRVVDLERRLDVFVEHRLQTLSLDVRGAIEILNHYYVLVHFPLTFGFIAWVFLRHRNEYRLFRTWLGSVTLAALAIHVAYPLAPPRMLRDQGFVDTLHRFGPRIYSTDTNDSVANQFAAMPSLHFGWALLIALTFIAIKRTRSSWLALVHPVITLLAIVATANHYFVDAAVAFVLVVAIGAVVRHRAPAAHAAAHAAHEVSHEVDAIVPAIAYDRPERARVALVGGIAPAGDTLTRRGESPDPTSIATRRKQRARHHHHHRRPHRPVDHRADHRRSVSGVGDT